MLFELYNVIAQTGNPAITLDGIALTMPPETRFTSIKSIQTYVSTVRSLESLAHYPRASVHVRIGTHEDTSMAFYNGSERLISLPKKPSTWAMRELVVLHELTHHFTIGERHGPRFAASMLEVLREVMGPEVELALRIFYDRFDVDYRPSLAVAI